MIKSVDTKRKIILIKGRIDTMTADLLRKLEKQGYTVYIAC
jgi:hypothetical protein